MDNFDIYNDIAVRTNGDIYVGIVGPVRTGKSTFISKFMTTAILDNITNEHEKKRAIDETPQSGAGKTIMTMQPKFIPSEAVSVNFGENVSAKVRLIDCVGYMVEGSKGFETNGKPRMVKTPWSEKEITFEEAAQIGTHKVISEHSTIAVLVTTDGSVAEIPRENYIKAEEQVVNELKENKKPFVIVLNSKTPESESISILASELQEKYDVPVIPLDATKIDNSKIIDIIKTILFEFPVKHINFRLPKWIMALPFENEFIQGIMEQVKTQTSNIYKMSDYKKLLNMFENNEDFKTLEIDKLDLSIGSIDFYIPVKESLYYKTLSNECGIEIKDDFYLMTYLKELVSAKKEYDKIKYALNMVKETGYGVVRPSLEDLILEEPEIITKNGTSCIKLKATAPSLHIMRVDVSAEVSPAVGSVEQSGSLVSYMMNEFENNKNDIWNKNIFGKPMNDLVKDSIDSKISGLPEEVKTKMKKTLTKIVNERKGGVICILL